MSAIPSSYPSATFVPAAMPHPGEDNSSVNSTSEEASNEAIICPECSKAQTPYIGQCFNSIEEATEFYLQYARICGFSVRIGTKHLHSDGTVITKRFHCHREGFSHHIKGVDTLDSGDRDSRNRKLTRCGCKARLCVKYKSAGAYTVYDFEQNHNHTLASDVGKQFLKNNRGLTFTQQLLMLDCGRLGMGATKAHRFMAEMAGGYGNVGATLSDFKNFKRDLKMFIGGCDAQMVVEHFQKRKSSCPDYSFEYFSDSDGNLCRIFWADATSKRDSLLFGDVISFDATYSSNK